MSGLSEWTMYSSFLHAQAAEQVSSEMRSCRDVEGRWHCVEYPTHFRILLYKFIKGCVQLDGSWRPQPTDADRRLLLVGIGRRYGSKPISATHSAELFLCFLILSWVQHVKL
jgi:hypothetical protein